MIDAGTDWQDAYTRGETPWDLRRVTPALDALCTAGWFDRLGLSAGSTVAVPGCGRGHDLRPFAGLGCRVTGFDLAPAAVEEARRLLTLNLVEAEVLCRDVLGLLPEWAAHFDLVYEHTCLCALQPYLRKPYAEILHGLLRPGGHLLALIFPLRPDRQAATGPPFTLTRPDLEQLFGQDFTLISDFEPSHSAPQRAGLERWFLWQRR